MSGRFTTAAQTAADLLLAVVLAPACAVCRAPLRAPTRGSVCPDCWASIRVISGPSCTTCGLPLPSPRLSRLNHSCCDQCRRSPGLVAATRAAGLYDGALRDVIHAFKYEGRRSLAGPLGRLMHAAAADLFADADCLVPVPLHRWRRIRRGFNQAADLARALIGPPVVHALRRTHITRPQLRLHASERRENVGRAFALDSRLSAAARDVRIEGRVVILIDDVRTTGATLEACARVLTDAGAREVRAIVAAVAATQPHGRTHGERRPLI